MASATLSNVIIEESIFTSRRPKGDAIKAVKVTEDNAKKVAAHILKALGGSVEVTKDHWIMVDGKYLARGGYWVVEDYDYANGEVAFHVATLDERKKYDLR